MFHYSNVDANVVSRAWLDLSLFVRGADYVWSRWKIKTDWQSDQFDGDSQAGGDWKHCVLEVDKRNEQHEMWMVWSSM